MAKRQIYSAEECPFVSQSYWREAATPSYGGPAVLSLNMLKLISR